VTKTVIVTDPKGEKLCIFIFDAETSDVPLLNPLPLIYTKALTTEFHEGRVP
jgi:hypothetical protein